MQNRAHTSRLSLRVCQWRGLEIPKSYSTASKEGSRTLSHLAQPLPNSGLQLTWRSLALAPRS
jgi:hypothetical protein